MQKQPFVDVLQINVLKNFAIFTGNTCFGVFLGVSLSNEGVFL